ncbi:MAG: prepilin-type N-terminal cleavage/methylation domain-containing protein [Planctomycetota bacterium]
MNSRRRSGFSLIELVIVVVIIGIIAAIAIPRMSRGSAGAADSALIADLAVMRNALDLYITEHTGTAPDANFVTQMTQYTNLAGGVSATKTATHIYGPYLRDVPILPVGSKKGETGVFVDAVGGGSPPGGVATDGWYYNSTDEVLFANLPNADTDDSGTQYNSY